MISRKKWTFLWILVPILIVISLGFLFLQYFFDPAFYGKILQDSLTQTLGREVSIGEARVSLWGGVGVTFEDFRIQDRSRTFDLIRSKRLFLKAKLLPLLKREIQWERVILDEPTLTFLRDSNGQFNFADGPLTREGLKVATSGSLKPYRPSSEVPSRSRRGTSSLRIKAWVTRI